MDTAAESTMKYIDFRSDTVTQPTKKMREAMYNCEVGDDVFNDDPTVHELEALAAAMVGKEAALFVPSGTFGNQLCVFTHCNRGDEIILSRDSHIFKNECGALATIAAVQTVSLPSKKGFMDPKEIENSIRCPSDPVSCVHQPKTTLLCLENALASGLVVPLDLMEKFYNIAKTQNLKVHLDGARVFNAATYLKCDVKEITKFCDSVMFCLSKGLCSPVGSIIAGDKDFINRARFKRKLLGGGLRQVGVLAACGLISLKEHVNYLADDHRIAKLLCEKLMSVKEIEVFPEDVQINFVYFNTKQETDVRKLAEFLKSQGIMTDLNVRGGLHRLAVHYYIREKEVLKFVESLQEFFKTNNN